MVRSKAEFIDLPTLTHAAIATIFIGFSSRNYPTSLFYPVYKFTKASHMLHHQSEIIGKIFYNFDQYTI